MNDRMDDVNNCTLVHPIVQWMARLVHKSQCLVDGRYNMN